MLRLGCTVWGWGNTNRRSARTTLMPRSLPDLTADDLIGIGVTSVGHRRKLLAAIAALREWSRADASS